MRSVARLKHCAAYQEAYERSRARARVKLRRLQWELAAKGCGDVDLPGQGDARSAGDGA